MTKLLPFPLLFLVIGACASSGPAARTASNAPAAGGMKAGRTVRDVDWKNRTYAYGENGAYTVQDGEYSWDNGDDDRGFFQVSAPVYGDVTGDGVEEAIIVTVENDGGTGQFDGIDVYAMRDGEPYVIGAIPGGDRGFGGIESVAIEGGVIVVRRYDALDTDGACCPSQVRIERWRWTGEAFLEDEAARRVEPLADAADGPDAP